LISPMSIRDASLIYERGNLAFLVILSGSLLPAALIVLVILVLLFLLGARLTNPGVPLNIGRVSLRSTPLSRCYFENFTSRELTAATCATANTVRRVVLS
jgi:hypothetical protein